MAVKFVLTMYDPESDELVNEYDLPGFTEGDVRMMFALQPDDNPYELMVVQACHRGDLERVSGHEINLNDYDYFVEGQEVSPYEEVSTLLKNLVWGVKALEQIGAINTERLAQSARKNEWYDPLQAAILWVNQEADKEDAAEDVEEIEESDEDVLAQQAYLIAKARKIITDILTAADYLREGGALDSLSHAPDGGKKWYDALAAADFFIDDLDADNERDEEVD